MTKIELIVSILNKTTLSLGIRNEIKSDAYYSYSNIVFKDSNELSILKQIEKDGNTLAFINRPNYDMMAASVTQDVNNIRHLDLHNMSITGLLRLKLLVS